MAEYLKREDVRRAVLHNEGDAVIAAIDELPVTELQDWMSEKSAKGLGINSITHWMPLPQAPEV